MPAPLLSRLASRDQVCRDVEHVNEAFVAALGGDLTVGLLNTRVQLVKEKEPGEHEKLHLAPDKGLFLLRQHVVFQAARGRRSDRQLAYRGTQAGGGLGGTSSDAREASTWLRRQ